MKGGNKMNYEETKKYIKQNPLNYIGYYELGKHLESKNKFQAYLSYENALYHCTNEITKVEIQNKIKPLVEHGYKTEPASIVILSYNKRTLTQQCLESIRETTPESAREIIVVDNNSKDDSIEYLRQQEDIILVENDFNAGFPGGCNIGIKASNPKNDIFLLNNDTILCANSLYTLRMGLYENENYGSAGCVTSNCKNEQSVFKSDDINEMKNFGLQNNIINDHTYENKIILIGFAVLIKRKVLNKIGLLDEIYFPGNNEDEDLSLRILKEHFQNILVHNSYIIHLEGQSFNLVERNKLLEINRNKFNSKFNFEIDSYFKIFLDSSLNYYDIITSKITKTSKILDMTCDMGVGLLHTKYKYPQHKYFGLDNKIHTALYSSHFDNVDIKYFSNFENNPFINEKFDVIIIDTTKIVLSDLEVYIKTAKEMLNKSGTIYFFTENLNYYENWYSIIKGNILSQHLTNKEMIFNKELETQIISNKLNIDEITYFYLTPSDTNKLEEIKLIEKAINSSDIFVYRSLYKTSQ